VTRQLVKVLYKLNKLDFLQQLLGKKVITMNNTQDNMNNTIDKKHQIIRTSNGKQPGGKDRPPNSKVGPGRGRYNKGYFKR
jgi:hypothetical protein